MTTTPTILVSVTDPVLHPEAINIAAATGPLANITRLWKTHHIVDEDHKILWITFPTSTTGNTNNGKPWGGYPRAGAVVKHKGRPALKGGTARAAKPGRLQRGV